jgi:hypothetical protein
MRLFNVLCLAVLGCAGVVLVYDLWQGQIIPPAAGPGLIFDVDADSLTVTKPAGRVNIVFADMFGPGEPVMRVHDEYIGRFEVEYGARLSAEADRKLSATDRAAWAEKSRPYLAEVRAKAAAGDTAGLAGLRLAVIRGGMCQTATATDAARIAQLIDPDLAGGRVPPVRLQVEVAVERRWQGRWVLSANRPRFLSGRDVPDIMVGSKMELLALVEDDYAVPLDRPLADGSPAPLDTPDTWGDPSRAWRAAFMASMLDQGRYPSIRDALRRDRTYFATLWCTAGCIFYNKNLFAKAGIETPPATWPEFIAICDKLKAAGIAPLTADQAVYADMWMQNLVARVLGPEAWEATVLGVPADVPPAQRTVDPAWTDQRYLEAFGAIRALRDNGYFREGFEGLTWPAAQRGFAAGDAAMMICGSWLVQELAGYENVAGIDLDCFPFPTWPGGREVDQRAVQIAVYGMIVCRQGGAVPHAIELVKYLSARDHRDMVLKNAQISCMRDAVFPPDLAGIADSFRNDPPVYDRFPNLYAPRFNSAVIMPRFNDFFMAEPGSAAGDTGTFLKGLDAAGRAYLGQGGEAGFE